MKKILDEEEFLERILKEGFSRDNNPTFHELLLVAKHFRQTEGFGQKRLTKALVTFCLERNEYFNRIVERDKIKKVAQVAIKKPSFITSNYPLCFSENELDAIRKVRPFKYQTILFSTLAFSKAFGNVLTFSNTEKNISAILRISGEKVNFPEFKGEVTPLAFLYNIFEHIINGKSGYYKMDKSLEGGDIILEINKIEELRNAGEFYRQFIGGLLAWCDDCDKEFIKLGKTHAYCESCSVERRRERDRIRKRDD